jgi:hypothetical protein
MNAVRRVDGGRRLNHQAIAISNGKAPKNQGNVASALATSG